MMDPIGAVVDDRDEAGSVDPGLFHHVVTNPNGDHRAVLLKPAATFAHSARIVSSPVSW